ncbi:MAG: aconitate hydratase, partial [Deltaproteobacteria bacterium]|nr:aconitate hydratase [Deltaproteobacteria bacterium]
MGLNVVQKVLKQHLVEGDLVAGKPIAIKVDQTLTQDATGTMADLEFEQMGADRAHTNPALSYVDHKTIQMGFEDPDDHKYLQTFAAKYGELLSRSGNGICHQVQIERFGKPGTVLLGSDSHTPTGGGIGQIAIGVGGMDVAAAMAGMPFYLTCPKVVGIKLVGKLKPFVAAKDVILKALEIFDTKGNVGWVAEYIGPGVETLSVPERATITNMGAEMGMTFGIFPSDDTTKKWLRAQRRELDWKEILPDPDATYDRIVEINLDELEPMVAQPHSPGNVVKVREIEGMAVDQVCIGSCTNSSYKDGRIVAEILDGKHAHPNVQLVYVPGSKQVFRMAADEGWLSKIIAAGAVLVQPSCSFCIGIGYAPKTDGISVRTNNRNFYGRSGTLSASIYLVSPETAAATAITGVLTDPRDLKEKFSIEYP